MIIDGILAAKGLIARPPTTSFETEQLTEQPAAIGVIESQVPGSIENLIDRLVETKLNKILSLKCTTNTIELKQELQQDHRVVART